MKQAIFQLVLLSATLFGCGAAAGGSLELAVGGEFTSGKYGGAEKTEIWYVPVTGKYGTGPWLLKLTVPYLRITGPGNIVGGNGGNGGMVPLPTVQNAPIRTASGPGDVVAGVSYAWYENWVSGVLLDLTGKIKFGTADKEQGLGTGEDDYSFQGDISKRHGDWTVFAGMGWKEMGNPPEITFKNHWFGSLGASYRVSSPTMAGMVYDHREAVVDGGARVSEITAFLSQKVSPGSKIQAYVLRGFSGASPDWGAGMALSVGL